MMSSVVRSLLNRQFVRSYAGKVIEKPNPKSKKIKAIQARFTVDDGVPVYLKAGTRDKVMFQITAAGVLVGLGWSVHTLIHLIIPGWNPPPQVAVEEEDDE